MLGRTHMTEFSFSGVGLNPRFDAPSSIWDRASQRVPGGSSSGAALSVAQSMAHGAIGTDTGGSCRIPAAFNGIVGFKPSAQRISRQGAFPLSPSLDFIGPLARSVTCCAILDGGMADGAAPDLSVYSLRDARIAIPRNFVLNDMGAHVSMCFERSLKALRDQGAHIFHIDVPEYDDIARLNAKGGFAAAESFHFHADYIAQSSALYDPRVLSRILRGREQTAADYTSLPTQRAQIIKAYEQRMHGYDFCLYPTVPIMAPPKADFAHDDGYRRLNLLLLRNPALINVLDGCATSIPIHEQGEAPVGLMLSMPKGRDIDAFAWAQAIESMMARS